MSDHDFVWHQSLTFKLYLWLTNVFLSAYAFGCWRDARAPLPEGVLACFLCAVLLTTCLLIAAFLTMLARGDR